MAGFGPALVALAAICWGLSGGIAAMLVNDGWSAYVVAFYRGAVGLLFVLVWLAARPAGSGLRDRRLWLWSILAGLGVAGNFTFYFLSIGEGSVAIAATLMYTAPVFVYLASFAAGTERVTFGKCGAIAMVLVGVVLLTRIYEVGGEAVTRMGVAAGLLSALSYAVFIFGLRNAARRGSPQASLTIAFTVLVVALLAPAGSGHLRAALTAPEWPLFLILGVLGAGLSFRLYVVGLRTTAPTMAAIVAMVEPVTAALFGVALLGDTLDGLQALGLALILLTVTLLSAREAAPPGAGLKRLRRAAGAASDN